MEFTGDVWAEQVNGYLRPSNQNWCRQSFKNNTVISIITYSEENAVKMRSFKSFSLRLRLRRFSDGINRGIDAMKI
jgi:hypothetical protein